MYARGPLCIIPSAKKENDEQEVMEIIIEDAQALTVEKLSSLSKDLKKKLRLEEISVDEELIEEDYVVWDVRINNQHFTFYHGFPGDNPRGILLDKGKIIIEVFEGAGAPEDEHEEAAAFFAWYVQDTKEGCKYNRSEYCAYSLLTSNKRALPDSAEAGEEETAESAKKPRADPEAEEGED